MKASACFLSLIALFPLQGGAQPGGARAIATRATQAVLEITATLPSGDQRSGTGFFVRSNGTFVTNYHVIEGASSLSVALPTGEVFRLVYFLTADSDHDLAILRVGVASPGVLDLGSDATLEVGDRVYAMSNPLGLERTFSEGILSSKRLDGGVQLLQITAPISPGSSGGPVMDATGKVVGVATLVTRQGQALNWAVPVHYLAPLVDLSGAPQVFSAALAPHRRGLVGDDEPTVTATTSPTVTTSPTPGTAAAAEMERKIHEWVNRMNNTRTPVKLTHEIGTGALRNRQTRTIPVELDRGIEYVVIGVCDQDCTDLDLQLRQLDGTVVSTDTTEDDLPVVSVTVARSGKFNIIVSMAACSDEPCWYGVGVITKR